MVGPVWKRTVGGASHRLARSFLFSCIILTMTTIEQDAEKYIRNSIRAYLEGTQDEKWLVGVASAVSTEAVGKALEYYGNEPRLNFLREAEVRRLALIASAGASTRLAGSKLDNKDVEKILIESKTEEPR